MSLKADKSSLFVEIIEALELNENPDAVSAEQIIKYVFEVFNLTECEEFVEHVINERGLQGFEETDEEDGDIDEDEDDDDFDYDDE